LNDLLEMTHSEITDMSPRAIYFNAAIASNGTRSHRYEGGHVAFRLAMA
jgi:hypothetical protein